MNVRSIGTPDLRSAKDSNVLAHLNEPGAAPAVGADRKTRADAVAEVAAANADLVDREARFPHEAIAAARSQRLLGIMVQHDLGGEGASVSDVVDVCYVLGR